MSRYGQDSHHIRGELGDNPSVDVSGHRYPESPQDTVVDIFSPMSPSRRPPGSASGRSSNPVTPSRAVRSANWRASAGPPQGTPPTFTALTLQPPFNEEAISIEKERNCEDANPSKPKFLAGFPSYSDASFYYSAVIPYVQSLVFRIDSMVDLNYFNDILKSQNHPHMDMAVRSLDVNGFHWFSGVRLNRTANPFLRFAATLPNLQTITLRLHTAGLTLSVWSEKDRLRLEASGLASELEKSKQLKTMRVEDVAHFYDLGRLTAAKKLQIINLECLDSEMVRYFCKTGDPLSVFNDIRPWIYRRFLEDLQIEVTINSRVVKDP